MCFHLRSDRLFLQQRDNQNGQRLVSDVLCLVRHGENNAGGNEPWPTLRAKLACLVAGFVVQTHQYSCP